MKSFYLLSSVLVFPVITSPTFMHPHTVWHGASTTCQHNSLHLMSPFILFWATETHLPTRLLVYSKARNKEFIKWPSIKGSSFFRLLSSVSSEPTTTAISSVCYLLLPLQLQIARPDFLLTSAPPPLFLHHTASLFPFLPEEQMGFNSEGNDGWI